MPDVKEQSIWASVSEPTLVCSMSSFVCMVCGPYVMASTAGSDGHLYHAQLLLPCVLIVSFIK